MSSPFFFSCPLSTWNCLTNGIVARRTNQEHALIVAAQRGCIIKQLRVAGGRSTRRTHHAPRLVRSALKQRKQLKQSDAKLTSS
jgi:hypothetical protein